MGCEERLGMYSHLRVQLGDRLHGQQQQAQAGVHKRNKLLLKKVHVVDQRPQRLAGCQLDTHPHLLFSALHASRNYPPSHPLSDGQPRGQCTHLNRQVPIPKQGNQGTIHGLP